jgi:hypothetical protein
VQNLTRRPTLENARCMCPLQRLRSPGECFFAAGDGEESVQVRISLQVGPAIKKMAKLYLERNRPELV